MSSSIQYVRSDALATLLHIDTSLDTVRSNTRGLSAAFVAAWHAAHPEGTILRRDLAENPAPPLSTIFVRAVKTPPERRDADQQAAWAISEALSTEFLDADRYVIGMPMHILTVPSPFKAYVEQIFHEGRVFRRDETGFHGLLSGRKFVFFLSKGADYRAGAPLAPFDMLEPYLVKLFTFCGVAREDMNFISVNNALSPNGIDTQDATNTERRILKLAETW